MIDRWGNLVLLAVVLIATLFLSIASSKYFQLSDEVVLPFLAITGIIALIGVLALTAIGFSYRSLSDQREALGLPPGSVTAVIALSLVVLFGILSVFLFGSLDDAGRAEKATCVPAEQLNDFVGNLRSGELTGITASDRDENGIACRLALEIADVAGRALEALDPARGGGPSTLGGTPSQGPGGGMPSSSGGGGPSTPGGMPSAGPGGEMPSSPGGAAPSTGPGGGTLVTADPSGPPRFPAESDASRRTADFYTVYFRSAMDPAPRNSLSSSSF
jgi:hypothetical protein